MFDRKNPYDWQRHRPEVEIARSEVSSVADKLRRGKSGARTFARFQQERPRTPAAATVAHDVGLDESDSPFP